MKQRRALGALLDSQRELYNAALEERIGAWKWERRSVSYVDQCKTLTGLRVARPDTLAHGVTVCRGSLRRLDRAFAAFYRRCKAGETAGFPRFKGRHRWDSAQWEDTSGWKLDESARRLCLQGIGHVKLNLHRPLRGVPKAITVRREGRRWWVSIRCVDVPAQPLPGTGRMVGVDLGVASVVATSDGELSGNPRHLATAQDGLVRAQQALATKRRGSGHRRVAVERVARAHRKVRDCRADWAHKMSRRLVDDFDVICHEDLRTANMLRRPKPKPDPATPERFLPNGAAAKAGLNRCIQDAGWSQLLAMIAYKAEDAGRAVIAVNPANTSRRCAECGHTARDNRRTQAEFRCQSCGHEANADINAAINILRAGLALRANTREAPAV